MTKQLNPNSGKGLLIKLGKEEVLRIIGNRTLSDSCTEFGFANSGSFTRALDEVGFRIVKSRDQRQSSESPRIRRVKGFLPAKTGAWVCRIVGLDPEEIEPGWSEFKQAREIDPVAYRIHCDNRLKDQELELLKAWIESNEAAESAAAKAVAATLKPKFIATLRKAHEMALEFDSELAASIHELLLKCVLND